MSDEEHSNKQLRQVGHYAAVAVGVLSLVYAVFFLFVAPSDQRGSDIDAFFRSYSAHPMGLRVASLCLVASGLLVTLAYAALHSLRGGLSPSARTWALGLGTVAGIATAAHGLGDLVGVDKLAHQYASGDAATRAAVVVAHSAPSSVDPRGVATFGLAGIAVFAFALHLRPLHARLSTLGLVLGVDMVLLFVATAFALKVPILLTGGLASVVLGPVWWFCVGNVLNKASAAA